MGHTKEIFFQVQQKKMMIMFHLETWDTFLDCTSWTQACYQMKKSLHTSKKRFSTQEP
jgi:hypothetical protein